MAGRPVTCDREVGLGVEAGAEGREPAARLVVVRHPAQLAARGHVEDAQRVVEARRHRRRARRAAPRTRRTRPFRRPSRQGKIRAREAIVSAVSVEASEQMGSRRQRKQAAHAAVLTPIVHDACIVYPPRRHRVAVIESPLSRRQSPPCDVCDVSAAEISAAALRCGQGLARPSARPTARPSRGHISGPSQHRSGRSTRADLPASQPASQPAAKARPERAIDTSGQTEPSSRAWP